MNEPATNPLPPGLTLLRFEPAPGQTQPAEPTRVVGDQDKAQIAALIEEVLANPRQAYVVDMVGCMMCGTMRLGVLLRIHQALRRNGRVLRVAVDHPELQDVFRLTRLNTIIAIFSTLESAIEEVRRQP